MSFENFAKKILRKFGNPRCCTVQYSTVQDSIFTSGVHGTYFSYSTPGGAVQYSTVSLPRMYMVHTSPTLLQGVLYSTVQYLYLGCTWYILFQPDPRGCSTVQYSIFTSGVHGTPPALPRVVQYSTAAYPAVHQ